MCFRFQYDSILSFAWRGRKVLRPTVEEALFQRLMPDSINTSRHSCTHFCLLYSNFFYVWTHAVHMGNRFLSADKIYLHLTKLFVIRSKNVNRYCAAKKPYLKETLLKHSHVYYLRNKLSLLLDNYLRKVEFHIQDLFPIRI